MKKKTLLIIIASVIGVSLAAILVMMFLIANDIMTKPAWFFIDIPAWFDFSHPDVKWTLNIIDEISVGIEASLQIFGYTLLFGLPLGMLVCIIRRSKFLPLSLLAKFYISVMRGTPLMLQLFAVFYGPFYLFGTRATPDYRFQATIIAFSINYAAYFAEIYRGGIEAVPKGQYEAAKVLGYSRQKTFIKIVCPQMLKNIIPATTNEIITLVKDTSLAYTISYIEMFTLAKMAAAREASVAPLFVAGVFYYVFNLLISFVMGRIEKKLSYYD